MNLDYSAFIKGFFFLVNDVSVGLYRLIKSWALKTQIKVFTKVFVLP